MEPTDRKLQSGICFSGWCMKISEGKEGIKGVILWSPQTGSFRVEYVSVVAA